MKLKSTKLFVGLFIFVAMFGTRLSNLSFAGAGKAQKEVKFMVRIENISSKDFQTASNGEKWPFALSPGMWVAHNNEVRLFNEGKPAILGLEAQAEDGNPTEIVNYLMGHHNQMQHGMFNTPVGTDKPAPIGPGGAFLGKPFLLKVFL